MEIKTLKTHNATRGLVNSTVMEKCMERSKLELDRCILFPRTEEAVSTIENKEIDSRYEIEVINLNFSELSKLRLYGFFDYSEKKELTVPNNSFTRISAVDLPVTVKAALKSRKQTNNKNLHKLIDTFVEKVKRSNNSGLPIWFNT